LILGEKEKEREIKKSKAWGYKIMVGGMKICLAAMEKTYPNKRISG
jgi:di/tricarboxylate transporter